MVGMRLIPALLVAALALGACSSSRSQAEIDADAVKLVQDAMPGATEQHVRDLLDAACSTISLYPTKDGVRQVRDFITAQGADSTQSAAIVGAAVAAKCPQYVDLTTP